MQVKPFWGAIFICCVGFSFEEAMDVFFTRTQKIWQLCCLPPLPLPPSLTAYELGGKRIMPHEGRKKKLFEGFFWVGGFFFTICAFFRRIFAVVVVALLHWKNVFFFAALLHLSLNMQDFSLSLSHWCHPRREKRKRRSYTCSCADPTNNAAPLNKFRL